MSRLSDKIQSFSPEVNIEFDQAYTLTPTNTGSTTLSSWVLSGTAPTFISSGGPLGGSGYWNFPSATRFRQTTPAYMPTFSDGNYVTGIWFRYPNLPTGAAVTSSTLLTVLPSNGSIGFTITVSGTGASPASRLHIVTTTTTPVVAGPTLQANRWYYLAFSRGESGTFTNRVYLDGTSIYNILHSTSATATSLNIGSNISTSSTVAIDFANLHSGTTANFSASAIGEIWTTGSTPATQNVNNIETPATASALSVLPIVRGNANEIVFPATASAIQTQPTIAVEANDHVEITTSIVVSALMAPATVSTQRSRNVLVGAPAIATAQILDNIFAGATRSVSFSSMEFVASAVLVRPFLAEQPMTASAQMGTHAASVTPNYFNLVKQLNPYLYINNGATAGSTVNYGYQSGTFTRGSELLTLQDGGAPLDLVAEGQSWRGAASNNANGFMDFTTSSTANSFKNLIGTGNFAYEIWAKPLSFPSSTAGFAQDGPNSAILRSDELTIWLREAYTTVQPQVTFPRQLVLTLKNSSNTTQSLTVNLDSTPLTVNNWNHVVVNVYRSGINANQRLVQLWINGQVVLNSTISFTAWTDNTTAVSRVLGARASSLQYLPDAFFDELAIYNSPLTNSQIVQHYSFISAISPNFTHNASSINASAESGVHAFIITSNATPEIKEATGSALLVGPSITTGRSFIRSVGAFSASATITQPSTSIGNTRTATPITAYAESVNAFALNSVYYDYVQANITPYRYVTFDAANVYADYGTDADFAVQPTVVGGTIVNPDEGISGKSAKTAGINYVTDGVILKESQYNDDWGTSGNRYHTAFWIQKAQEDNSTGLRVIWNLNGNYNNEHIILYQYQGRLTLSFNDGTINFINQTTANNINLFDGQRHFVVIDIDHVGVNDTAYLYVDAALVMTVSLGSYRVETINGITNVGPNDEQNNHPRMSVGCLITPFASTSLPVIPTNTRVIVDEIYWAKTAINQASVTALYNIMPDKDNSLNMASSITASALAVMPSVSTSVNYRASVAIASALVTNETITADRNIVIPVNSATASAQMANALRINNVVFASDIMVATATFNNAGVRITLSGGPMLANVSLINDPGIYDGIRVSTNVTGISSSNWYVLSPWATWIRASDSNVIMPAMEVN